MTRITTALAILLLLGGIRVGVESPASSVCTLASPGFYLRSGATPVLAVATGEWVTVSPDTHPYVHAWRGRFQGPILIMEGDTLNKRAIEMGDSVAGRPVRAQQFWVVAVHEVGNLNISSRSVITVAPWGHTVSCAFRPFSEEEWVPTGDTVVFQLRKTRESTAAVFDVSAPFDPYPQGQEPYAWYYRRRAADRSIADTWLSSWEYWDFLSLFPAPAEDMTLADRLALDEAIATWATDRGLADSSPVREWKDAR
jgi:hypothetical protein